MKPKVKKYAIGLAAAFVAIVSTLTASQHILTQRAIANAVPAYNGEYDDEEANANMTTVLVRADRDITGELNSQNMTYTAVSSPLKSIENSEGGSEAVLAVGSNNDESSELNNDYYSYVVDFKSPTEVASASKKLDMEGVDVNKDFIFHVAGPSGNLANMDVEVPDIDVNAQLEEGKTLRQIADENDLRLVAVIDTGVNGYASYSVDFTGTGAEDKNGHGTHVAEKILEKAGGKAMIISLKAMDDDGTGKMTNVYQAVEYAKAQQVDIINMSIAAYDNGTVESDAFRASVESAVLNNIVVVAAAGNYSSNIGKYLPAGIPGVISVGAMNEELTKTHESNYGNVTYYENEGSTSEAAASISGKIASGADQSEFVKEKDVALYPEDAADFNEPAPEGFEVQTWSQTLTLNVSTTGGYIWEYSTYGRHEAKYGSSSGEYHFSDAGVREAAVIYIQPDTNYQFKAVRVSGMYPDDSFGYNDWIGPEGECNGLDDGYYTRGHSWLTEGYGYITVAPIGHGTVTVEFERLPGASLNVNQNIVGINKPGTATPAEFANANAGVFKFSGSNDDKTDVWMDYVRSGTGYTISNVRPGRGLYLKSWSNGPTGTTNTSARTIAINYDWVTMKIDPGANGTYDSASGVQSFNAKDMIYNGATSGSPTTTQSITLKKPVPGYYYVTLDPGSEVGAPQRDRVDPELDNTNPWKIASSKSNNNSNGLGTLKSGTVSGLTYTYGNYDDTLIPNALYPVNFPVPEKYGYEFQGWYTAKNGGGTKVSKGNETVKLPLTSDTTYYAYFVQKNVNLKVQADVNSGNEVLDSFPTVGKFNITYQTGVTTDASGNKVPVMKTEKNLSSFNKSLKYGSTYEITAITPTDYYLYDASSTRNKNHTGKVIANTTSTIAFKGIPYTVEFNNNDDGRGNLRPTGSVPTVSATYGLPVKIPTQTYAWRGREFKYYSNNKDADPLATPYLVPGQTTLEPQKYIDLSTKKSTLYAIWEVHETTVTVKPAPGNYDGNTNPIYFTNAPGITQEIPIPTPPEGSITIQYDKVADDAVLEHTSDVTHWAFKDWTINDDADGTLVDSSHYTHGVTFDTLQANYFYASVPLPTPTREGYTFLGWYEDAKYIKKAGNAGATNYHAPGDITLYARWFKDNWEYSDDVEFFVNDQKGDKPQKLIFRKEDADSGLGMTSVTIGDKEYTFKFEVYEGSINTANLKFKIDSKLGLLSRTGASLGKLPNENAYIDLTDSLTVGKTYIIHETESAPGYELAQDLTFTYNENAMKQPIAVVDRKFPTSPPGPPDEFKADEYGRPVSNAEFDLRDLTTGQSVASFSTNEEGNPDGFDLYEAMQAGHKYGIVETSSPEGFGTASMVTIDMPTSADDPLPEAKVVNDVIEKELEIKKTSADDKPLAGAEFQLFVKNKNGILIPAMHNAEGKWVDPENAPADAQPYIGTSNVNGLISFKNLPLRATFTGSEPDFTKSYYLVELKAPPGYVKLPHEVEIRIPDDGKAKVTYTAKDGVEKLTLSAGGNGAYTYAISGGLLLWAACLAIVLKKKNEATE